MLSLAACSDAPPPETPSYSPSETSQALQDGQTDAKAAITAFSESEAVNALSSIPGSPSPLLSESTATGGAGTLNHESSSELPRHVYSYTYDASSETWGWIDAGSTTGNLELHWPYDEPAKEADLVVDWDHEAETVTTATGTELPRSARATLTADEELLGQVDVDSTFFSNNECGITGEPTSLDVEGFLGTPGEQLTFMAGFSVTEGAEATIATTGDIDLVTGEGSTGVDWQLNAQGSLTRGGESENCSIVDAVVNSGSLSLGAYAGEHSARLNLSADDIQTSIDEPDPTASPAVDVDGSFAINGVTAFSFTGTLDDEDGDGIPGENIVLTFAEEESMTLEAFIEQEFVTAAAALATLHLLR